MIHFSMAHEGIPIWYLHDRHGYQNWQLFAINFVMDTKSKARAVVVIFGPLRMHWVWKP